MRFFRVIVRKTAPAHVVLALHEITNVVASRTRSAKVRARAAAAQREAHVRSFVFHEIGNLSTGLFGILDQLREGARMRSAPKPTLLASFDTLLTSMRDVLQNMMGFTQITNHTLDGVATEVSLNCFRSLSLSLSLSLPVHAEAQARSHTPCVVAAAIAL